jgi:hypothetical protein
VARNSRQAFGRALGAALLAALLLGVCAGALVVPLPGAVASAPLPARETAPLAGPQAPPSPGQPEREPTSADLEQQRARVAQLRAEAERRAAGVDDAEDALHGASVLAGQALEEYAAAVRSLHTQQRLERQHQDALTHAQGRVETSRRDLGRWARQAYSRGSGLGGNATVTTLLSADTAEDVGTNLTVLRRIGRDRSRALEQVRTAERQADLAAGAAAAASAAAAEAAIDAEAAKTASEAAVNRQRQLLGRAESSLQQTTDEVSDAEARAAGLRAALLARTAAGPGVTKDNRVTGEVGSCTGAAVEQYPNGQIPVAALCPLRSAPGHHLRADAAYAFDRLGQAYATRFGHSICVTDSYRSYAAQVSVYARKPGLAAVPGTSNHGWGTALDLCGGIQSFSSAQHRWMSQNASLYGWFHPGWAQQNGSKPEPWHWEYGG